MVKISTITGLGALIVVMALGFLGFPIEWKNFIYVVSGALIVILSLMIRKELEKVVKHLYSAHTRKTDTFSESNPEQQEKSEELK